MPDPIPPAGLSEAQAARHLSVSPTTLALRRKRGKLPPGLCVKISENRLVYVRALLERWLSLGCPESWPPGEPKGAA